MSNKALAFDPVPPDPPRRYVDHAVFPRTAYEAELPSEVRRGGSLLRSEPGGRPRASVLGTCRVVDYLSPLLGRILNVNLVLVPVRGPSAPARSTQHSTSNFLARMAAHTRGSRFLYPIAE